MFIVEKILSAIAPHTCEGCGAEGRLICASCLSKLERSLELCYRCQKISPGGKTCKSCRSSSKLSSVRAFVMYNGIAKQLIWKLKFQRARAAGDEIGQLLATMFDDKNKQILIVHVPTASSRVRVRGYDQSAVIARQLAKSTGLRYLPLLCRMGQHKQVGTSGMQRRKRMEHAFQVRRPLLLKDAHVLLVDDVITTGATLEAAAKTLRDAGAKKVEAVVFTRA